MLQIASAALGTFCMLALSAMLGRGAQPLSPPLVLSVVGKRYFSAQDFCLHVCTTLLTVLTDWLHYGAYISINREIPCNAATLTASESLVSHQSEKSTICCRNICRSCSLQNCHRSVEEVSLCGI